MIHPLRKINQDELKYVYDSAEARMKFNPEIADKFIEVIGKQPFFDNTKDAIKAIDDMENNDRWSCQIWAKIGKDEEYYFIQDYYIVTDSNIIKQAADYIGMIDIY